MERFYTFLLVVQFYFKITLQLIPYEFSHHINNNWEKLQKDGDNKATFERIFLHHGRIIGDVILDTRKFLGEFHDKNDTNLIMSCELEIAYVELSLEYGE